MRRFLTRFLLGTLVAWSGSFLVPGIETDREVRTFILFGFFLAVGEAALPIVEGGAGVLLFFLPRSARRALLRAGEIVVASGLVTGFWFSSPIVGILGLTLLFSVLLMLPFTR